MPRVNQLLNWVMGINFLCGIVFLLAEMCDLFGDDFGADCLSSGRLFV